MLAASLLSIKQSRFVDEFLVDGNGTRAAIRAGYSTSGARLQAYRLLNTNEAISEAVKARQQADSESLQLTRQDVLSSLLEAANMAREQANPIALIAAAREIGKLLGFYAPDRVDLAVSTGGAKTVEQMQQLNDSELLEIIAAGTEAAH